jgi:RNA polymerase sigma factor (sigma-70 family)
MTAEPALDVPACLDAVRMGNGDAARTLVEHLYPLVMKIVRSHLPRRTLEEDLAQEVFLKLFARMDQYEGRKGVPFEHWVSRLTVTTCLDALRAEKRRPEWRWSDLSEAERQWVDFMVSTETADVSADAASAREVMAKLLDLLSPSDRLVISLLDIEERSVAEISRLTGWSVSLVKVRAFRARRKLRRHAELLQKEMCL